MTDCSEFIIPWLCQTFEVSDTKMIQHTCYIHWFFVFFFSLFFLLTQMAPQQLSQQSITSPTWSTMYPINSFSDFFHLNLLEVFIQSQYKEVMILPSRKKGIQVVKVGLQNDMSKHLYMLKFQLNRADGLIFEWLNV